jgi:hypothetical protein
MDNPSFSVCCSGISPTVVKCCCQEGLEHALRLFEYADGEEANAIKVSLFNIKYGGNFAPGKATLSRKLPAGSVGPDTVTVEETLPNGRIRRSVISICPLYGIAFDVDTRNAVQVAIFNNIKENLCLETTTFCCCNEGIYEELSMYEDIDGKGETVTISTTDTTNNTQNFKILKVCSSVVLLELTTGSFDYVIVPLCVIDAIYTTQIP